MTSNRQKEDRELGKTGEDNSSELESSEEQSDMKRAAARSLIEKFFYQLVEGCGNQSCSNENCASSENGPQRYSRDEAAAKALELFRQNAKLCDASSPKHLRKAPASDAGDYASKGPDPQTSCKKKGSNLEEISFLTEEKVQQLINFSREVGDFSPLVRVIGRVFSNWQALNVSFLRTTPGETPTKAAEGSSTKPRLSSKEKEKDTMDEKEKDTKCKCKLSKLDLQVDIESVQRTYKSLYGLEEPAIVNALHNAIVSLSQMAEVDIRWHHEFRRNANFLNCFLIIFENEQLVEAAEKAFPSICRTVLLLPTKALASLTRFWSRFPTVSLKRKLDGLQQLITIKVLRRQMEGMPGSIHDDDSITDATRLMKLIYYASVLGGELELDTRPPLSVRERLGLSADSADRDAPTPDPLLTELDISSLDCRKPLISFKDFQNEPLSDALEVDQDFTNYKKSGEQSDPSFAFLNYPFILTTSTKSMGLYYDNRIRMYEEQRMTVLNSLIQGEHYNPYLKIRVKRDQIVEEALIHLELVAMENPSDLKKQLYVEFEGEQGVDEGGVSKEFFQLIVEEIFNPDIGMFTLNETTGLYWFNPVSFETDRQFKLIGIVLGLAIYNNIILDANFPMVLYRKLMGRKGTFEDLSGVHPDIHQSLESIIEFEGDVEETFLLNFQISYTDVFGAMKTHDLKKDGASISVTGENRQEYVNLYTDFLLNKHIHCQFQEFKRGFDMVTSDSPLSTWFTPDELDLLVCGSKEFDFNSLEEATEYDGGYTRSSRVIKEFWEVVHEFDHDKKKLLLMFATGSDRVPVGGLNKLRFIITRNGPDSDRLPSSHTCFNVLLLPEYSSKEKLSERLLKAITHAKGFGML